MAWFDSNDIFEFFLKIGDSFFQVFDPAVFVSCTADVFNCVSEKVVKLLITNEVPDFYCSSGVVGWAGQFFTRLDTVLQRQKF